MLLLNKKIYPPQKRTIITGEGTYFLQFPYMVFAEFLNNKDVYSGRTSPQIGIHEVVLAFAVEENPEDVYFPFLPNIYSNDGVICLNKKDEEDLDSFVDLFWNSSFGCLWEWSRAEFCLSNCKIYSYDKWTNLSLEEVLEATKKSESIEMEYFLKEGFPR